MTLIIMQSIVIPSVNFAQYMLSVILNVIMLSVVILNVVPPDSYIISNTGIQYSIKKFALFIKLMLCWVSFNECCYADWCWVTL